MSSWKTDIPKKVAYLEHCLSHSEFPETSRQVVHLLERYFKGYVPGAPPKPGLFESAFLNNMVDSYIFHSKESGGVKLSATQELALLELLCACFQNQSVDIVRCAVFNLLFGFSSSEAKENKVYTMCIIYCQQQP